MSSPPGAGPAGSAGGEAIAFDRLTKRYGKARGVEEVDLTVGAGTIFGFIGPNGAGKTTAIRTLLGFLRPTSGTVRVFGQDVARRGPEVRRRLGYLPADVRYYRDMRVDELLRYSARFHGPFDAAAQARLAELAGTFGLALDRRFRALSTGNRKKVGIVQALLHRPDLLVLDEPTSGLDPLVQHTFFRMLREERERGTTVFFSSHVLGEVQRLCDRVAVIREGRVVDVQDVEDLLVGRYKRVRVRARDAAALAGLDIPGRTAADLGPTEAEWLYRGDAGELLARLAKVDLQDVTIEEPSLDDVFLHYYDDGSPVR
nr:ABC transporter [uncultured bacterium]